MDGERGPVFSRRLRSLAQKFRGKRYRDGYVAAHTRGVLAKQMRNFRGELSQQEFADRIGKQKTMIARLENSAYGGWSLRTMLEIARKRNLALIVRFVDFPTFLKFTGDLSDRALNPPSYDEAEIEALIASEERNDAAAKAWSDLLDTQKIQRADGRDERARSQLSAQVAASGLVATKPVAPLPEIVDGNLDIISASQTDKVVNIGQARRLRQGLNGITGRAEPGPGQFVQLQG